MVKAMLEPPDLDRYDRPSLRTGGIGSTGGGGHGLFEAFVERIGVTLGYEPYGMTEVNAMAMFHRLDEPVELRKLPGIIPAPGLEVRVVHPETGAPCDSGQEGELQFRGPLVSRGYYKKPDEIEAFRMAHPDGAQGFVVGVPDPRLNEAPVAYVIAAEGARLTAEDLRAFCRGRIASYKIPIGIRFVKDVP